MVAQCAEAAGLPPGVLSADRDEVARLPGGLPPVGYLLNATFLFTPFTLIFLFKSGLRGSYLVSFGSASDD